MPQINRIRVNNVKYNFGTQFYDDFVMRFSGKNTIYDLANGGGKSVLMLLLLQNLIPNCTLDDKQPVEKLFRTGSGSNTIHSLIEWKLDKENIKNNYRYMLTGFCARKAKDEQLSDGDNTAIEYFNYCIFYREFNDNDLKNLPLNNGKERITYNGLKAYLRELEKKDYSLEIKIFERKGEYQRFIAEYGLYESQWEIIRGINKTEGHVRTYFENNYKTTRKVVEDLLIEEIIEKSFKQRVAIESDGDIMAKTLLDIKDKLIELSKKKDDINNYDRQIEAVSGFKDRVSGIKQLYFGRDELITNIKTCYYTLAKIMKEREMACKEYEEEIKNLTEKKAELEKNIDTIKVQKTEMEMEELSLLISELDKKLDDESENLKEKEKSLLYLEAENDYMDYLYYKRERDSVKEAIEALMKGDFDKENADKNLSYLADEKSKRNKGKLLEIEKELEEISATFEKEEATFAEEVRRLSELEKELAVSEYLFLEYEKKIDDCNKKIYKLKESANVIMESDLGRVLENEKKKEDELLKKNKKLDKMIMEAEVKKQFQKSEEESIKSEIEKLEEEIENLLLKMDGVGGLSAKLDKIKMLYSENNIDILAKKIDEKYKEVIGEARELSEKINLKKKYKTNLEKGCAVGESKEVQEIISYIEKYHGDVVVSGAMYLSTLSEDERKSVMERFSVLPYSIIVKSDFLKISMDLGIKRILAGDYAVPLVKYEALMDENFSYDNKNICFVMRDETLFTDAEAIKKELEKTSEELRDLQDRSDRLSDVEISVRSDYDFVKEYRDVYREQIERDKTVYEEKRLRVEELKAKREAVYEAKILCIKNEEESLSEKERLSEEAKALGEKIALLAEAFDLDEEQKNLEHNYSEYKEKCQQDKKNYSGIKARTDARKDSIEYRKNVILSLKNEKLAIEKDWDTIYKSYFKEGIENNPFKSLSDEEIDAKAKAFLEISNGASKDIKDKQKLMENYDIAMEKSLQAIDYKGILVDEIKNRVEMSAKKVHSKEELLSFKKLLDGVRKNVKSIENELIEKRALRDKSSGALMQGIASIEEKYGFYEKIQFVPENADAIIRENKSLAERVKEQLVEINGKLLKIQKTSEDYIIHKRDIEKIIEEASIAVEDDGGTFEKGVDLKEMLKNVSEKYDKYKRDIEKRKEELEYEKAVFSETLTALSSYQLAEEIRREVRMPKDMSETEELLNNLGDIILCIHLEKGRIEKSIEDMEKIKANFENQCIQSCVNIKTELDRLPKLSKIYMDEESISIIGLDIPYVKEDEYKKRMSSYIDDIVDGADRLKDEEERIRYIKNQLSWKRLFSVIVSDMNGIRLTLYKRERIKEQSRYLRYEEAVGSTGQSQGIYIQFLIAIINYITAINSGNTESRAMGKVVFIDNPFGAAKDIYIWEPIFKLLKTNNVQLVVPCRGATPAITGRFDVNYVLGQKMTDGKQQTVVVEYYSNVDSDSVEYEKLSFEQNELIFN